MSLTVSGQVSGSISNVNLDEAFKSSQAETLALMGKTYLNLQDFQARVFLRLESQVDIAEAAASLNLANAGLPAQLGGLNAGSQTPRPTLG